MSNYNGKPLAEILQMVQEQLEKEEVIRDIYTVIKKCSYTEMWKLTDSKECLILARNV